MGLGIHELARAVEGIQRIIEEVVKNNLPIIQQALREMAAAGRTVQEGIPGILEALDYMGDAAKDAQKIIQSLNNFLGYLSAHSTSIASLFGVTVGLQVIAPIAQIFFTATG